eukprot:2621577-Pleurochrysis_carterae.AAC.1
MKAYAGPHYETAFITDRALREISGLDSTEKYTACADQFTSRATAGFHSKYVAWIEIDYDGRKSVVQVRVLRTEHVDMHPFAYSWIGLTMSVYVLV